LGMFLGIMEPQIDAVMIKKTEPQIDAVMIKKTIRLLKFGKVY
jgi:hypothetical protein